MLPQNEGTRCKCENCDCTGPENCNCGPECDCKNCN